MQQLQALSGLLQWLKYDLCPTILKFLAPRTTKGFVWSSTLAWRIIMWQQMRLDKLNSIWTRFS